YSKKAIQTYEKLNEINPNYSEVHLNLGIMYAQQAGSLPRLQQHLQEEMAELQQQMTTATGAEQSRLEEEYGEMAEELESLLKSEDKMQLELMKTAYNHMKDAA